MLRQKNKIKYRLCQHEIKLVFYKQILIGINLHNNKPASLLEVPVKTGSVLSNLNWIKEEFCTKYAFSLFVFMFLNVWSPNITGHYIHYITLSKQTLFKCNLTPKHILTLIYLREMFNK